MARRISRGSKDFEAIFEDYILPTSEIYLCRDRDLTHRRQEVQAELDSAEAASLRSGQNRPEGSQADEIESDSNRISELKAELDEIDERIRESDQTDVFDVQGLSEDAMNVLDDLREKDSGAWVLGVIAAVLGQPSESVAKLRERVSRATWNHLFAQAIKLTTEASAGVPMTPHGSESDQTSHV